KAIIDKPAQPGCRQPAVRQTSTPEIAVTAEDRI
ncbi:MAG: hypothetical protein H6Q56_1692, partial [Deltaproteobacteria bacterium]|nr:hypothetical protein [Deltaproteobacteria bacterium]